MDTPTTVVLLCKYDAKLHSKYVCLHISGGALLIRETSVYNGEWLVQRNLTGKNAENKVLLSVLYYMEHVQYFHQSPGYIIEEGIKKCET